MLGKRRWSRVAGGALLTASLAVLPACGLLGESSTAEDADGIGTVALTGAERAGYERMLAVHLPSADPASGDLDRFWQQEYPLLQNATPYRPVSAATGYTGWSIESECGSLAPGNAYYCPQDEAVYYDENLLQSFFQAQGEGAALLLLAHEYGHHITGLGGYPVHTVQSELQADCFAGSYMGHIVGGSELQLEELVGTGAALFVLGDSDYASSEWFAPDVHGPYWWRARAFLDGATGGSAFCSGYAEWADVGSRELGAYTWLPAPGFKIGTRPDGSVLATHGETTTLVAAGERFEGNTAIQALPFAALGWFGAINPTLGQPFEVPTTGLLEGTAAAQTYTYQDASGQQVHGVFFLHVSDTGDTAVVSTFGPGEPASMDAMDASWDSIAGPLFVAANGLCSADRDGALCPRE